LRVEADAPLLQMTRPGQFYQLKCPVTVDHEPFLLRPMSVYGIGPENGAIEFLYNVVGIGTQSLSTLQAGETMDIVGPLGNAFTFNDDFRRVLLVARGVGFATMAPLVQRAVSCGIGLSVVMSARSPEHLLKESFLRGADASVHCVYDSDGTSAPEAVETWVRRLMDNERPQAVYTCGSHRLLMLLQRILGDYPGVVGEVALEQRMACGMGVCLSCVRMFDCEGGRQFLRVCRDGPVFPIRDVVDEVVFV